MDKINFEITEITPIKNTNLKDYDVRVILNEKPLGHVIFNASEVVPAGRFHFAEFDLFTCGCGVAGCAGFMTSVIQNKTEKSVKWIFPTDKSYKVEKLEYEFDRVEFENTVEALRSKMLELEKENIYPVSSISDDRSYGNDNAVCEAKSSLAEDFKWQQDYYDVKQNFENLLKQKFPTLCDKLFTFQYDGKQSAENLPFNYLICKSLNQWPANEKEKAYLKKVEAMGNAIVEMIYKQNYIPFAKMVHSSYHQFSVSKDRNKFDLVVFETFEYELQNMVEEDGFSLNKLKLVVI